LRFLPGIGRSAGMLLGGAICALGPAEAQEYCVSCTEPPAVYRCIIEGARPGGKQPLQMLCVTTMAKMGHHATCSVKGGTVFDCDGQVKRIPWSAHQESALPKPEPETAKRPAAADPKQPPQTVEEMARRANAKAAEQIKKANEDMKGQAKSFGKSIGDATRKTWRCVSSLFTRCLDD
jgi:hypothetical protein